MARESPGIIGCVIGYTRDAEVTSRTHAALEGYGSAIGGLALGYIKAYLTYLDGERACGVVARHDGTYYLIYAVSAGLRLREVIGIACTCLAESGLDSLNHRYGLILNAGIDLFRSVAAVKIDIFGYQSVLLNLVSILNICLACIGLVIGSTPMLKRYHQIGYIDRCGIVYVLAIVIPVRHVTFSAEHAHTGAELLQSRCAAFQCRQSVAVGELIGAVAGGVGAYVGIAYRDGVDTLHDGESPAQFVPCLIYGIEGIKAVARYRHVLGLGDLIRWRYIIRYGYVPHSLTIVVGKVGIDTIHDARKRLCGGYVLTRGEEELVGLLDVIAERHKFQFLDGIIELHVTVCERLTATACRGLTLGLRDGVHLIHTSCTRVTHIVSVMPLYRRG